MCASLRRAGAEIDLDRAVPGRVRLVRSVLASAVLQVYRDIGREDTRVSFRAEGGPGGPRVPLEGEELERSIAASKLPKLQWTYKRLMELEKSPLLAVKPQAPRKPKAGTEGAPAAAAGGAAA